MAEDTNLSQFRDIFLSEAKENLQLLSQCLLVLEKNPTDKESINSIFRQTHTLKSMAATMGFEKIKDLSHHMEDVFDKIKKGETQVTSGIVDTLFSCLDTLEELVAGVETSQSRDIINLEPLLQKLGAVPSDKTPAPEPANIQNEEASDIPEPSVTETAKPDVPGTGAVQSETIRINVSYLDSLMNLVGELVINKGRLEEISERHKISELEEAVSFLDRLGTDLQTTVLKTRMVPVSHIFDRFPRMVRDVSRKLSKEVNMIVSGADIEIDRTLLEQINEPLVHILRNAIDHGIETKEERLQANKDGAGNIFLSAKREQSAVAIEVKDDGKGMSVEKLKTVAIQKGILTEESAGKISDREAYFLVCDPRFSSAEKITEISGRGVGMDVVKSAVESVNGTLSIDSQMGMGSTITLKLPLSLAIIRVLLIRIHGEIYALPLANIEEIISIANSNIKTVDHKEVIVLREQVISIVRLDKQLGVHKIQDQYPDQSAIQKSDTDTVRVAIVESGQKKVGFVVSSLIGRREVVVKNLTGICKQAKGLSGATILGDGKVVLILDVGAWL